MRTFTQPRPFVESRRYARDREKALKRFDPRSLDPPIRELVTGLNDLAYVFTLQSCFGHFLWAGNLEERTLSRVPTQDCGVVTYRIAYVAFCLADSKAGRAFRDSLAQVADGDPDYVQFGSAGWFWRRHPNTYAIQVEPARFCHLDKVALDHAEALLVQERRDIFFERLGRMLLAQGGMDGAG